MLKDTFHLTDADFKQYNADLGLEDVKFDIKPKVIKEEDIAFFKSVYGEHFVRNDDYSRLSVAYGKTMYDLLRFRQKKIENIPDVVVYPDSHEQIEKTVAYCQEHNIPLYVYGGGSSVTAASNA
jgi:alkyldihydroxyacetonephosphate synthase